MPFELRARAVRKRIEIRDRCREANWNFGENLVDPAEHLASRLRQILAGGGVCDKQWRYLPSMPQAQADWANRR